MRNTKWSKKRVSVRVREQSPKGVRGRRNGFGRHKWKEELHERTTRLHRDGDDDDAAMHKRSYLYG